MIGDGSAIRNLLGGRQTHDVGLGLVGSGIAGARSSPLLADTALASNTSRSYAGPAQEPVTFRDARAATPPSRVVPGIKRTVMTPQRRTDLAAAAAPPTESVPLSFEKADRIVTMAPEKSGEFPAYPHSKRLEASLNVKSTENAGISEPWSRARMDGTPAGLSYK